MYKQYSEALPWLGVSRVFFDRVLTDDELMDASEEVRTGITEFATGFARLEAERGTAVDDDRQALPRIVVVRPRLQDWWISTRCTLP